MIIASPPPKKVFRGDWGANELHGKYNLYCLYDYNPCHRFCHQPLKHFSTARQLNFLGHVGQHIDELVSSLEGANAERAKHLGLGLPFGHDNIEAWMRCRYPVWLQFHRVNLAGLAPASSPAAEP